jgi:hypothetical protein
MTTKTVIVPMAADNPFGIKNVEDYAQINVVTSEGKDTVTLSIPWFHELTYTDERVQDAILKCKEMGENALSQHIKDMAAREAAMTSWDKIVRFFRRAKYRFKKALGRTKNIW